MATNCASTVGHQKSVSRSVELSIHLILPVHNRPFYVAKPGIMSEQLI